MEKQSKGETRKGKLGQNLKFNWWVNTLLTEEFGRVHTTKKKWLIHGGSSGGKESASKELEKQLTGETGKEKRAIYEQNEN